jgi:hypothetical protein
VPLTLVQQVVVGLTVVFIGPTLVLVVLRITREMQNGVVVVVGWPLGYMVSVLKVMVAVPFLVVLAGVVVAGCFILVGLLEKMAAKTNTL